MDRHYKGRRLPSVFSSPPNTRKLIRISPGNISNNALIELFSEHLALIEGIDQNQFFYLELGKINTLYTF